MTTSEHLGPETGPPPWLASWPERQVLRTDALGCARGGRMLFSGLDVKVGSGEALIVSGPNGSGKSSLLRVLAGLLAPEAGRVLFPDDGREEDAVPQIAYIGHLDGLKPSFTVEETLIYWQGVLSVEGGLERRVSLREAALTAFGLWELDDTPVAYLSAGQRRRLALARLVACPKPLWLLDEPTVGLDRQNQTRFSALMQNHLAVNGLIVAATHVPLGLQAVKQLDLGA